MTLLAVNGDDLAAAVVLKGPRSMASGPAPAAEDAGGYSEARERFLRRARRRVRRTAYEEAGHAVAALDRGIDFEYVAVQPLPPEWVHLEGDLDDDEFFSFGWVHTSERISLFHAGHIRPAPLIYTLAGRVAEARHAGRRRIQWDGGARQAERLAVRSSLGPWSRVVAEYLALVRKLVDRRWDAIEAVALALVDRRVLGYRDVRRIAGEPDR